MARRLASLLIDIEASTAKLSRDVNRAVGIVESGSKRMASSVNKAKAVFGGLVAGIGIQNAIRGIVSASVESEKAMRQLEARVKSTGGAAGLTVAQLQESAKAFQAATTFDDEAIQNSQALLLTFTRVTGDTFNAATQAILDMSIAMDQDLKSSTLTIGKALNDPIKGLSALTRVGVSFTEQQKEQIKQMAAVGDMAGAQKMILSELAVEFGGAAAAARDTLGGALESLRNKVGDLIENDSASLPRLTEAINRFNDSLSDPQVKASIDKFTTAIIDGLSWIVENGPDAAENLDRIASGITNAAKAFVIFKAAAFGAARGGPIGGALLGTVAAMELYREQIGMALADPRLKQAAELAKQDPLDKMRKSLNIPKGGLVGPDGLQVKIGAAPARTPVSPRIDTAPAESKLKAATAASNAAANAARQAEERRLDAIRSTIEALEEENFALGKSTEEILRNNLAKLNTPPADVERAVALLRDNEAYEANKRSVDAYNDSLKDLRQSVNDIVESLWSEEEALRATYERRAMMVEMALESGLIDQAKYVEIIAGLYKKEAEELEGLVKRSSDAVGEFALEAARAIQNSLGDQLFNIMQGRFDDIGTQFKATLDRMVADALAAQLAKKIFGDFDTTGKVGGWAGSIFGGLGKIFGGARAAGGPVSPGRAYLVGEKGPELMVPSGAGRIIPNGQFGGGGVVVNMNVYGVRDSSDLRQSSAQVAAQAGLAVQRAMNRNT